MHGISYDRIHCIPNAVDSSRFAAVDETGRRAARGSLGLPDAQTVAVIGALSPEKDVGTVIRAMEHLDDVVLLVVGEGPERAMLEALARERLPEDRVRFLGVVDESAPVYAAADAVVLSSLTEGMPAVLIEAGMSGLPSVATAVGGVEEIIIDGDTGVVVPPRDPRRFAQALSTVLGNPADMGERARERCRTRFDIAAIADRWLDVLRAVT